MPYGAASSTSCTEGEGNYGTDPHFDQTYYPVTTFVDTGFPSLAAQCGNLVFQNRVRWFTTIYATSATFPAENPWKYWWRRARYANDGSGVLFEQKDSLSGGIPDTATVEMPLNEQYDAVGVVLITDSSGNRQISDLPFTSETPGPWGDINLKLQHWRRIPPPTLTSVTHQGGLITLRWTNEHAGRSIDSTNIYRNGEQLTTVGPGDTSFTEASPGVGTWTYALKHVSWPAALAPQVGLGYPNSDMSDSISITLGTACARRAEDTTYRYTWQYVDQYLSAGCSEQGTNKRFRWFRGDSTPLGSWTSDTLFDFAGHDSTDSQIVVLRDSNTSTDATSEDTLAFTVSSGQLLLEGPTYITDKATKVYVPTAGGQLHVGQWFERYDDGPQWYPATAYEQDTLLRIWPAGAYTVDLRQHTLTGGVLHRGRLAIEVCNSPSCGGGPAPPLAAARVTGAETWDLFGAGPWIGWGGQEVGRTLRLYDLWGMHDRRTPFTDVAWFTAAAEGLSDAETGWQVTWVPRALGLADVRVVDLAVAHARVRPYVFSMAVDPDLGAYAGDDVASYDAPRGLVLVADGTTAVGFLLVQGGRNALASVQEYGVGRWAPRVGTEAWTAQREPGVRLRGTPGDVQLVLSAGEAMGTATWTFVVIRGATPLEVRALAEEALRALR